MFITGGLGYIGGATTYELARSGVKNLTVYDDLSTGRAGVLKAIARATGADVRLVVGSVQDSPKLIAALARSRASTVLHFAGSKSVGESMATPVQYYWNNVQGMISVLQAMDAVGVRDLVFSSSASVYGEAQRLPITESHVLGPGSTYGRTKAMCETVIKDWTSATAGARAGVLRYFNPVGAYPAVGIGEIPKAVPQNLVPYVSRVAAGLYPAVQVYGQDYSTADGTGVRDYVHIQDLALGHLAMLRSMPVRGCTVVNLGTGIGHSVLEVVREFQLASGKTIEIDFRPRRPGDVAAVYADVDLARTALNWEAKHGLAEMCRSQWEWQIRQISIDKS